MHPAETVAAPRPCRTRNVSNLERKISLGVGGALIASGLMSRSLTRGLLLAAAGAAASYRGITGHCYAYDLLGVDTASQDDPGGITFEPEAKYEYPAKDQLDQNRFDKLTQAQVARGRDEEQARKIAAEEVTELRRREGSTQDEAEFIQEQFDKRSR